MPRFMVRVCCTVSSLARHCSVGATLIIVMSLVALFPHLADCQTDTGGIDTAYVQRAHPGSIPRTVELIGALGIAAALDRPDRTALMQRGPDGSVIHPLSQTGNALGTANHLIPALAAAYVFTWIRRTPNGPSDVLDAALGYAASDMTAGAIRWAVGRERPSVHGDPMRFHPFTGRGEYHSFPSGHVTHIMAIATAAAIESHSAWVRDVGIGTVGLVAWQRIHADQHWTSDVVGAAIISNLVSREVVTMLRQHRGVQ